MTSKDNHSFAADCYEKFHLELTRFLGKAVSKQTDLQDLSQEIYLRVLRVKNPDMILSPRSYLYKIAIHVIDEWRNSSREQYTHISNKTEMMDKPQELLSKYSASQPTEPILAIELNNALKSLPPIYAQTILMKWHYGMNYKEISTQLKVTERQVKRYIVKGYAALRIKLERTHGDDHE